MYEEILEQLPYTTSFRFVDEIISLGTNGVTGRYTLRQDAFFYSDHFVGYPVTPGVIITEIMAQVGLAVLGIYLLMNEGGGRTYGDGEVLLPVLSSTEVSFLKIVFPGQTVTVTAHKQYFRFNKLKCYIEMTDEKNELIAKGTFAGFVKRFYKGSII